MLGPICLLSLETFFNLPTKNFVDYGKVFRDHHETSIKMIDSFARFRSLKKKPKNCAVTDNTDFHETNRDLFVIISFYER